ncbi:MAG: phosphoribosylformylglycinamidine synthase subunit PurQ [Anaerolineales bacterium]|nr:phosphoribosylformylglycinamidine synthase subunit PurQ [Anaerolineales bacterium]
MTPPPHPIAPARVLILHAPGTNRDGDLAEAIRSAGGHPEIVPLSRLAKKNTAWRTYAMLALPGGFSYGDALGAGRLWALELQFAFADMLQAFVHSGRPVIGICNGFQALVKAGILPGSNQQATLTFNQSGHFECRWVTLTPNPSNHSPWLQGLAAFACPVAHGEGRFLMVPDQELDSKQVALRYALPNGDPAGGRYPDNPNGSPDDIAGITNPNGNVLGLMPHPENHIFAYQHPSWTWGSTAQLGVQLFINGLRMA